MRPKKHEPTRKVSFLLDEVRQLTQERDDLVLLLIASHADNVAEVDLAGRPLALTTYRGPKRQVVRLRWRGNVPRISAKTRVSLRQMLMHDGRV